VLGNSSKVTVGSVDVPLIAHNETSVLDHCYYKTRKRCFSASDFFHNINQNKEKTDFCKRIAEGYGTVFQRRGAALKISQ